MLKKTTLKLFQLKLDKFFFAKIYPFLLIYDDFAKLGNILYMLETFKCLLIFGLF